MYVSLQAVQEQAVSRAHISTTLMTTPAHGCKKTCITWWSDEEVTSKATEVLGRYQAVHFDRTKTKGIFSNCLGLRSQTAKWTGFEHWRRIWSSLLCSEPRKHLASYVLGIEFWPALALEPNVKYKRFSVELWAHSSWPKQNSNAKLLAVFIFLWNPTPSNRQISRADTCAVSRLARKYHTLLFHAAEPLKTGRRGAAPRPGSYYVSLFALRTFLSKIVTHPNWLGIGEKAASHPLIRRSTLFSLFTH